MFFRTHNLLEVISKIESLYPDLNYDSKELEFLIKDYLEKETVIKALAAKQRNIMSEKFRESILIRDSYTCKNCGVSIYDEPHFLLEVDHITPVSKGGLSISENLQTLCWICNRSKGSSQLKY